MLSALLQLLFILAVLALLAMSVAGLGLLLVGVVKALSRSRRP